ncbi:MAG: hypothetical protein IIV68_01420 [Alistipes sp.]|nr:hypothetical protein [Alistipes sp.]
MKGDFFSDNLSRARATSVYIDNSGDYHNINSGLPVGSDGIILGNLNVLVNVKANISWSGITMVQNGDPVTEWSEPQIDYSKPIFANPSGEYRGNSPRSEVNRIRAVYRSGTK